MLGSLAGAGGPMLAEVTGAITVGSGFSTATGAMARAMS